MKKENSKGLWERSHQCGRQLEDVTTSLPKNRQTVMHQSKTTSDVMQK